MTHEDVDHDPSDGGARDAASGAPSSFPHAHDAAHRAAHPGAQPGAQPDPHHAHLDPLPDAGGLHSIGGYSAEFDHIHAHPHATMSVALSRLSAIADATLNVIRRHWLAGVNILLGTLIGVAVLTPIGYALGLTGASDAVFHAYRFICGQTPSHTFYIAGYQMCLCTRCLAIYSSLLTGGILLALLRHERPIRSLSWKYWLLAMLPMALDGGTQLFGLRESNLALRLLTGALFGIATAWFLFPQIEEASRDQPVPSAPANDYDAGYDAHRP